MKEDKEFFIFDVQGKLLKRLLVPIKYVNVVDTYLYTIHDKTLFQLVEEKNDESWYLKITGLPPF